MVVDLGCNALVDEGYKTDESSAYVCARLASGSVIFRNRDATLLECWLCSA